MLRLGNLAKWMLALGLAFWMYLFVVSYLHFRTALQIPEAFLAGWQPAMYAAPALVVLGGVLVVRPWLLGQQTSGHAVAAAAFMAMMLLPPAFMVQHILYFTWFAVRTDGRIVALHDAGRGSLAPEVEYKVAGRTYSVMAHYERIKRSERAYAAESLPVLYRKDAPAQAIVGTFTELWGFVLLLTVFSAFMFAIFLPSRLAQRRRTVVFGHRIALLFARTERGRPPHAP